MSEKETSPPRIAWPAVAMPSARLAATEPTPEIAITPSTMQAMKTPKPCRPPRRSRQAKRSASRIMLKFASRLRWRRRAGCADGSFFEASRMHMQDAIAARGKFGVVSDEHERRAALAPALKEKVDDLVPG